jgi:hypothetical protein
MLSTKTTIPRDIKGFNQFIIQTCAYLILGAPTNAVRFNWTAAALAQWQLFLSQWTPLFNLYSNKKESYTTVTKTKLEGIIANAVIYAKTNKLIELIKATASLNADDCAMFNLPQSLAVPSVSTHSIAKTKELDKTIVSPEAVYPKLIPLVGGFLKIKAFTNITQSGRAHKLKGFDLLEYAVGIFNSGTSGLPTHASDPRLTVDHSSKASFILSTASLTANIPALAAGATEPLRFAVIFFRWAKSKHPTLDGPWNGPFTTPLL